ncbi:hypothetical protein Tco_0980534 [Tanacetum coccineum]
MVVLFPYDISYGEGFRGIKASYLLGQRIGIPLSRIAFESAAGASCGQNDDVVQADDIQNEANELLKIRDFFSSSWLKRQVNLGNRDCSLDHLKGVNSCFRERVLLKNSSVKGLDLNKLLNNHTKFNKLIDVDDVCVCLLLALDFVFIGFELRHVIANELLGLVDDLLAWNDFPWGEYMWIELHKRVYNNDSKYRERHFKKLAIMDPTFMPTYTLQGFVFAFKVRNRLRTLTPSFDEMKQKWWRMSLEYFYNVSKAKVHREVDVRTNVHHDVEEGLSVRDLLKKISDMQWDFQSRITAVEKFTSKIGSDSHVTNVFRNSMEFDHHVSDCAPPQR